MTGEHPLIARFKASRHQASLICLGLALLTIAVYWRVGTFEFVNYDDNEYITENPWVEVGLRWQSVRWAFTTAHASNWHPLTWISHMADCQLFGMRSGPHHLVSMVFHIVNTLLLFLVLARATRELWKPAFVAALFALHPLHIQSVAWVAERKDLLSTFFWFLGIGAYLLYVERKSVAPFLAALFFTACGLMSKPMVVTMPVVLLLLDYWPLRRRWNWRLFAEKIPFGILCVLSCMATVAAQRKDAVIPLRELPLLPRLVNAVVAYQTYVAKTFWPIRLAFFYPHPVEYPLWVFLVSVAVIAGISWFVVVTRKNHPWMATGWAWYLCTLLPVIGIVQVGSQAYADRYTYVPLIGLFVMMTWGGSELIRRCRLGEELPFVIAALAIGLCACVDAFQLPYWKDSIALYQRALQITRNNYVAELNLGAAYEDQGRTEEAVTHFKRSLEIRPANANLMADLDYGMALAKLGDLKGSLPWFEQALVIDPKFLKARLNLADTLARLGRFEDATKEYNIALSLDDRNAAVHYSYATSLMRGGKLADAEREFRQCLLLDDKYVEAHNNLALLLVNEGRFDDALSELSTAVHLAPDHFSAQYNFAATLAKCGRMAEAVQHYREALRLRPESVEAASNLAWILATDPDAKIRDGAEAVKLAEQALKNEPRPNLIILNTAAAAYAEAGRFDEAVTLAGQAEQMARKAGRDDIANSIRGRIDSYRRGVPVRGGNR